MVARRDIPSRLLKRTAPLRHWRMSLKTCQNTPALGAAISRPNGTSYQLQPSFHSQSTEPEPTARARRAGKEFYSTTPEFMFVSFRLLVVESIQAGWTQVEVCSMLR